jgi:hypothetical protein
MRIVRYFASPVCGGFAGVARLDRRAADRLVGAGEVAGRAGPTPDGDVPDELGLDELDGDWPPVWKPRDFLLTHLLRVWIPW